MCIHISEENRADTKYEYMYTYKYPEQQVPEGGEASFAKSLNKEIYGYDLEVTVLGIEKEDVYKRQEIKRSVIFVNLISAGTRSPAENRTRSPTTNSSVGISINSPSRLTVTLS